MAAAKNVTTSVEITAEQRAAMVARVMASFDRPRDGTTLKDRLVGVAVIAAADSLKDISRIGAGFRQAVDNGADAYVQERERLQLRRANQAVDRAIAMDKLANPS